MRIIIDVDDAGVITTRTETIRAPRVTTEPVEAVSATPPPEVLEAAAKLGAVSAGPAPARVSAQTLAPPAIPLPVVDTLAAAPEDAGQAPEPPRASTRSTKARTVKKVAAAKKKKPK